MAGSERRTNIQGYTLIADPLLIAKVRRLSVTQLQRAFREAQEQGRTQLVIEDQAWQLICRPDRAYELTLENNSQSMGLSG